MHSSLYGKIEKASRYAAEHAKRIQITTLSVEFQGDNDRHQVELCNGAWSCSCDFFASWELCCHTMALEKVLDGMLPPALMKESKMPELETAGASA